MNKIIMRSLTASVFAVALFLAGSVYAADIEEVFIVKNCVHEAGQPTNEPYGIEFSLSGSGIYSASLITPAGPVSLEDWGDGEWGITLHFATETELNSAFVPSIPYTIVINDNTDSVVLANDALIPPGYATIMTPIHEQMNVPTNPTCTWMNPVGADAIAVFLYQDPNGLDEQVYENWPLDPSVSSIQATDLQPGTEYGLEVAMANIASGGIREETTVNGDAFTYVGVAVNINEITFSTESNIDIESVLAVRSHEITNNLYRAEISVTGTNITSVMVQGPAGEPFPLEDYGDGEWGAEEAYLTESDMLALMPNGNYTFTFNDGAITAVLPFNGLIPDGTINVTYPAQDAVNIGKNPTYTWENTNTAAEAQAVFLFEDPQNADEEVYGNMEVDTAATSIKAIDLSPSSEYRFEVVGINFAADPQQVYQTIAGDTFDYEAVAINIAYSTFTTAPMPDVTEFFLERTQVLVDGGQAPEDPFWFYVGLEDPLNITQASVTTPYGSTFELQQDEEDWYLDLPFASEAELAADWPMGTYTLTLNGGFDTITVDYNVAPPTDYVHITFPQHNQSAVTTAPTYTWDSVTAQCFALGLRLSTRDANETDLYEEIPVLDTTQTSWAPGPLEEQTRYILDVSTINLQNNSPTPMMSSEGDSFDFYGVYMLSNEAWFDTNRWPVPGDVNGDCKVNIIDLIAVRNRLNQDVGTDDNWKADVNEDGKINIIDLIYVRNRLNNRCEQ